jgi:hypothetical protein
MEEVAEALLFEAFERIKLDFNQVREFDIDGDTRVTLAG